MTQNTPLIVKKDPWLEPFLQTILERNNNANEKENELKGDFKFLSEFANGHLYFGIHKTNKGWIIRDWAPNAKNIFLIGDFNQWKVTDNYRFTRRNNDVFELKLDEEKLKHKSQYKFHVQWIDGEGERIPAWANRVVQDENTLIFNAQVWDPPKKYSWKNNPKIKRPKNPLIYEAHIGMGTEEEKVGSYTEFRQKILPKVKKAGYNIIQLMAIQEHPYYGSFGYHVSSFFAASSRFGTPEELKQLIDDAHGMGIMVIMDLVHSHAVKNEVEGLGKYDGTRYQFFHDGLRGEHEAWDSYCFNYNKNEVLHFLLSNVKYWLDEYHFDGYRFDGVTSMLYKDHGLSRAFTNYNMYFDGGQDEDAITYFKLSNKLIHEVNPNAITVAEEMSGYPGLAAKVEEGGLGFDYRLAMGIPDYWIKIIKEKSDEQWNVNEIYHQLTNKRAEEKTISYAESHDQALVGDKTLIFRLMDKEMYFSMNCNSESLVIDRGMALHKLIRLITFSTSGGGYLNFMGNEFGHPEWIDFPREGNNWSYKYARRQWSLAENKDLRYHFLSDFDREMIQLLNQELDLTNSFCSKIFDHEPDQVLAFFRDDLLFVFNFHPTNSYTDYGIPVEPSKFKLVLDSDQSEFGGFGRINAQLTYFAQPSSGAASQHFLKLYLPNRTAIVLKKMQTPKVY
jgi:1,4-alpha-glucan branching enzyme